MAQPTNFQETAFADSWSATWSNISTFSQHYELTEYYFLSNTKGAGSNPWNHATCIKLLIDKCNAMQAEIDGLSGGVDITMSDILTAMSEAEPHQPILFIAYLEAYRASVWNASFDELFFANLVKKWDIWG